MTRVDDGGRRPPLLTPVGGGTKKAGGTPRAGGAPPSWSVYRCGFWGVKPSARGVPWRFPLRLPLRGAIWWSYPQSPPPPFAPAGGEGYVCRGILPAGVPGGKALTRPLHPTARMGMYRWSLYGNWGCRLLVGTPNPGTAPHHGRGMPGGLGDCGSWQTVRPARPWTLPKHIRCPGEHSPGCHADSVSPAGTGTHIGTGASGTAANGRDHMRQTSPGGREPTTGSRLRTTETERLPFGRARYLASEVAPADRWQSVTVYPGLPWWHAYPFSFGRGSCLTSIVG